MNSLPFLGNPGSSPSQLVRLGDQVLFVADDGQHGGELWRSDGTAAGTRLVKDIRPGQSSSSPATLVVMGDTVFFQATTAESGAELWRSDGTAAGTWIVKDVEQGSASSRVAHLAAAGGWLFFSATTAAEGANLWKTDGTAEGTQMVFDFAPGGTSQYPYVSNLGPLGAGVILAVQMTSSVGELWGSDGTAVGTQRLLSETGFSTSAQVLFPATAFSSIPGVAFFNFMVGFSTALWRTDGTPEGTWKLGSAPAASNPYVLGSKLLFSASDGIHGDEPWITDGTVEGTGILKNVNAGGFDGHYDSYPHGFFPIGDQVGFYARTGAESVSTLWKTDGTADGTQMVAPVDRSIRSTYGGGGVSVGAKSVFFGAAGASGHGLWVTDGTAAGTSLLRELGADSPYDAAIVSLGTKAVFAAGDGLRGSELWVTDGTVAGTQMLMDICTHRWGYSPVEAVHFKSQLYFRAPTTSAGVELWRSNGTAGGTSQFYDVAAGAQSSDPTTFTAAGNLLYFYAKGTTSGTPFGLWRTDGSTGGTLRLYPSAMPRPTFVPWSGPPLAVLGSTAYFQASGTAGEDPWQTDGTVAGTTLFNDLPAASFSVRPDNFLIAGGKLFFTGQTAASNIGLYVSDGTAGTTYLLTLPNGVPFTNRPRRLQSDGRYVYFVIDRPDRLFRTDGTFDGTVALAAGSFFESVSMQTGIGDSWQYMLRFSGTGPTALWRTAGTAESTAPVAELPATGVDEVRGLMHSGGRLYFNVTTAETGEELWTSDGTEAGTRMVRDIAPGAESSSPSGLTAHAGYVLFSAWDAAHGRELWISDGTSGGTVLVEDFAAGPASAMPVTLTSTGDALFFFLAGPEMSQHELRSLPGFTLTTLSAPAAGGSVTGGGVHPAGGAVAVTAQPAAGFVFDGWSGLPAVAAPDVVTRIRLTGDLTLTARFAAVPGYDEWIADFPLPPEDRPPNLNPTGDGIANLLKYAFNLNPALPDTRSFDPVAAAGLPVLRQTPAGLRFEYPERRGAPLRYEPQAATDINNWHSLTGAVERTRLNAFWDMVSIAAALSDQPGFFRVRVTLSPAGP